MTGAGSVLILGGTAEARALAQRLVDAGVPVLSSLAGRVARPRLPVGEVRIGGFGGPEALARWLGDNDIARVVDATHPFAERISASAGAATRAAGVP
ncbi:MAG: cobalt-precorrin-6A reductase, partial [Solirubrobacterales bacterium]|nr:cobalt-precorrin-6A reductase [Solirubrobacterales bacterium]